MPVAMHLDGARLFDGITGEGVDAKEYCACFDSISICLAKGLGAPMGSIILGSRAFIERAKWFRKMFGGGTRQVFVLLNLCIWLCHICSCIASNNFSKEEKFLE